MPGGERNVTLVDETGVVVLQGSSASSGSIPVVIAYDQTPVPITGAGLIDVEIKGGVTVNITASLPLSASVTQGTPQWVVSASNWIPTVTGTVGISAPVSVTQGTAPWIVSGSNWIPTITGSVSLSAPVAISNFPATQNVTGSGWTPTVTGSVVVANQVNVTGSSWTQTVMQGPSGSVPWNVTGSVALTAPITGTVSLSAPITGTVVLGQAITGSVGLSGPVTGNVGITAPITGAVTALVQSGSVTGLLVGGQVVTPANPVPIVIEQVSVLQPLPVTAAQGTNPWTVTGSVGLTGPVTGNVGLTGPISPTSFRQVLLSASNLGPGVGIISIPRMPFSEPYVIINVKGPVNSGATASFYFDEVDPLDLTTFLTNDDSRIVSGTLIFSLEAKDTQSDSMRLYYQVTGSISGVNATVIGRWSGNAVEGQAEDGKLYDGEGPVLIGGVDNNNFAQVAHVDSSGNLQVVFQTVSAGASTGESFGNTNTGASGGTKAALRATTYTEQTASFRRSLKSTSAADLSGSGTGAWQVKITYYDDTMSGPFTETLNMSGTNAANTTNSMRFIEKMEAMTGGTAGTNQGTISIFQSTNGSGSAFGSIGVGNIVTAGTTGDNRTYWAHHYVATGKTFQFGTITFGTTANQAGIGLIGAINPLSAGSFEEQTVATLTVDAGGTPVIKPSGVPAKVSGPARVTSYVVSNGTNTVFYGGFEWQES